MDDRARGNGSTTMQAAATAPAASSTVATVPPREQTAATGHRGLAFSRRLSRDGVDPYSTVDWELRDAVIQGEGGQAVFEQKAVEFPAGWSLLATNVVTVGLPHAGIRTIQVISMLDTIAAQHVGCQLPEMGKPGEVILRAERLFECLAE